VTGSRFARRGLRCESGRNVAQSHMRREPVMKKDSVFVGLDVHAETIAAAVASSDGEVRSVGTIPNRPEAIKRLMKRLGAAPKLRVCYEAGPTGYVVYWQLTKLGIHCEVIAPTLVPVKAGERVKTDRRDAVKLARLYRSGDLTAVWVPDQAHEALRDLVRAREAAKKDELRARQRLGKFLLRRGVRPPAGVKVWTKRHVEWLKTLKFDLAPQEATLLDYLNETEHQTHRVERLELAIDSAIQAAPESMRQVIAALQALRGVQQMTAVTVVVEVGQLSRFARPKQLMGYSGVVPSEHSSGASRRQGAITKTGNAHLRRVLGEAAWTYNRRPNMFPALRRRQEGLSAEVKEIAWKAQHRLYGRFSRLKLRGKPHQKIVTAVARELLGFIWAIGVEAERSQLNLRKAA
jgi:transposase